MASETDKLDNLGEIVTSKYLSADEVTADDLLPDAESRKNTDDGYGKDVVPVGGSVRLVSIRAFCRETGFRYPKNAIRMLHKLGIPTWVIGQTRYFNLPTLEFVLFQLLRPRNMQEKSRATLRHLSRYWFESPLREEFAWVGKHYVELDRQATMSRLAKLAWAMRSDRWAMKCPRDLTPEEGEKLAEPKPEGYIELEPPRRRGRPRGRSSKHRSQAGPPRKKVVKDPVQLDASQGLQ